MGPGTVNVTFWNVLPQWLYFPRNFGTDCKKGFWYNIRVVVVPVYLFLWNPLQEERIFNELQMPKITGNFIVHSSQKFPIMSIISYNIKIKTI